MRLGILMTRRLLLLIQGSDTNKYFRVIILNDFVKKNSWPELVPELRSVIQSSSLISQNACSQWNTVNSLTVLQTICRPFQATMPTFKHPAHVPMWRGVKVAYLLIALCIFPVAIGGFWAYGNHMPAGGMLNALYAFHSHDIPRGLLATAFLLVVFNCLSSFQIYSIPVFDIFEAGYTSRTNRPCSIWVRSGFRVFYGFISFFIGVTLPFLSSIAGLVGGLTLLVTFAYPCFMWIFIKKPQRFSFSFSWYLSWTLGILGIAFSIAFSAVVFGAW